MIHEAKLLEPMSPKLSEKSNVETSPTHTGSETSRSYQPEGKKFLKIFCPIFSGFYELSDIILSEFPKCTGICRILCFYLTTLLLPTRLFSYF